MGSQAKRLPPCEPYQECRLRPLEKRRTTTHSLVPTFQQVPFVRGVMTPIQLYLSFVLKFVTTGDVETPL
jgi:hypothetical protein